MKIITTLFLLNFLVLNTMIAQPQKKTPSNPKQYPGHNSSELKSTSSAIVDPHNDSTVSKTVTDIDGNLYHTIQIGNQIWTEENLKATKYNDGVTIPLEPDMDKWSNMTTPGCCLYYNNSSNKSTYGVLYNWYTINTGKLAPKGWHVPSSAEMDTLQTYLKNIMIKEYGKNVKNTIIIPVLKCGYRTDNGSFHDGNQYSNWWSTTEIDSATANIGTYSDEMGALIFTESASKKSGYAVRLIKDN